MRCSLRKSNLLSEPQTQRHRRRSMSSSGVDSQGSKTRMTSNQYPGRSEMEHIWRERVKAARSKYELAVVQSRKVLEDQKAWPMPSPDGSAAIRNAHVQESAALSEYVRAL